MECGDEFVFTAGEQAFYREHNLTHAPTRCRKCRSNRKGARPEPSASPAHAPSAGPRPAREMHTALCAECGSETRVPFVPTAGRPVYCKNCFQSHRPERSGAARAPATRPAAGGGAPGSGRAQGVVKWFNQSKGFGFIRDDSGQELFVHFSSIQSDGFKSLTEGERVEFEVVPGAKGNQAAHVTRIG